NLFSKKKDIFASKEFSLIHLQKSAEEFVDLTQTSTNMAVLQVQLIADSKAKDYQLSHTFDVGDEYKSSVKRAISENTGNSSDNEIQGVFDTVIAEKRIMPITKVMTDQLLNGEGCYPMQMYLYTKTFPSSPSFYSATAEKF